VDARGRAALLPVGHASAVRAPRWALAAGSAAAPHPCHEPSPPHQHERVQHNQVRRRRQRHAEPVQLDQHPLGVAAVDGRGAGGVSQQPLQQRGRRQRQRGRRAGGRTAGRRQQEHLHALVRRRPARGAAAGRLPRGRHCR
jgi:hypothetical protein